MIGFKLNEDTGKYCVTGELSEEQILAMANAIAKKKISSGIAFTKPDDVKSYLRTLYQSYDHEVFGILFLNTQHVVLKMEILSEGTIDSASVYPRECVKKALKYEANAVVIFHNHPSGKVEESHADRVITRRLQSAFETVDIKLLDHIIVGLNGENSLAEKGLI